MADIKGFMKYPRKNFLKEKPEERKKHFREYFNVLPEKELKEQGGRCMDCGVPFCHTGCPLGNLIPDWNDLVHRGRWKEALAQLHATNNFPEFTGRICPAPCENACVLGINEDPVAIEQIEMAIADRGWEEGWIVPEPPQKRTDKKVAVVGSGPAGLAAAQQLNRAGHRVTVYERDDRPGGLLTYGVPDFKLSKEVVFRRVKQLQDEGIEFVYSVDVGRDMTIEELKSQYDAVLLACGARVARDIMVPGRDLTGVYPAMDYLTQQNRRLQGDEVPEEEAIWATEKDVIVIGGGDTGSDCVGTANRQGARSVTQFQYRPMPANVGEYPRIWERPKETPWPLWTNMLRTSSSHEEGCNRHWCTMTKRLHGDEQGNLVSLETVELEWTEDEQGRTVPKEVPGSEKIWPCQLMLIAIGFAGKEEGGLIDQLKLEVGPRGSIKSDDYNTPVDGVFVAGDFRRGQSLIVWAIYEGREAARKVDEYLMGYSELPSADEADYVATPSS